VRVDGRRRAARARAIRRRRAAAAVVGVAIVAAAAYGATRLGGTEDVETDRAGGRGEARPAELLSLQVTGTDEPLIALVGTRSGDRPPAFFTLPVDLMLTAPGQGETPVATVAREGGDTVRLAVSNTFGVWAEHFAVLDLRGLSAAVGRVGSIRVRLPDAVETDTGTVGPGVERLNGERTAALLAAPGAGGDARWAAVVQGLLASPPRLERADVTSSTDLDGVRRALRRSAGAGLALFPTSTVAGSVVVPRQPDLDRQVARAFGVTLPVPVIVENGVGTPGLGQDVAEILLPEGFRVVVSQNAEPFGFARTRVVANGAEALADARRIREALGVGRVGVSRVPSGIGDVTIVVGEDFSG
jgi:LytR cell envelope-related transcriptional attenuator